MKHEEFKFQIVTPMFLGGAGQQAEGIRPASTKGALRFWWRALNWARCWQASEQDDVRALRLLHAEEARLFGVSAGWDEKTKKPTGGQGIFLISVQAQPIGKANQLSLPGQRYLLGQGLTNRSALNAGEKNTFTLKLVFHPQATAEDIQQLKEAVKAFGLLGALGSRARHGLGSVALIGTDAPTTRAEYIQTLQNLLKPTLLATGESPFTAFSACTRIDMSVAGNDALKLLDFVGCEQQLYRSYGRKGMVNNVQIKPNFPDDHDLMLDAINGIKPSRAPRRAVFGLPHNYHYSGGKGDAKVNYLVKDKGKNRDTESRRASPLFLHIHRICEDEYLAIHICMPAQFLPAGEQICIEANRKIFNVPSNPDWQVLHGYLDRFKQREVIHGQ